MKYLKILGLAAVAAMALTAFLGAGTASATNLYQFHTPSANTKLAIGTTIVASLKPGTSALLKDTGGLANDTCTTSELHGHLDKDTTSPVPVPAQGRITSLTFGMCSHTTTVLAPGELEIKNISGTTNGTVISRNARVTIKSTVFGISCTANTGAGTTVGTLQGSKSTTEHAEMTINGVITLENGCGDSTWSGTYIITTPTGVTVEAV